MVFLWGRLAKIVLEVAIQEEIQLKGLNNRKPEVELK